MADGYLYKFTNGLHGSTCARKQQTHWIRFGLVCFDQWFAFAREGLFRSVRKDMSSEMPSLAHYVLAHFSMTFLVAFKGSSSRIL